MRQKHLSTIIALGVALAFIVLIGLSICVFDALSVSNSDDQCDYMPPPQFTWEGELNPNDFDNWEILNIIGTTSPFEFIRIIENPDEDSSIEKVAIYFFIDGNVLGYRYFKDGHVYSYTFDSENDKYVEYEFTQEQKDSCMKCHQDKLISGEPV